MSLPQEIIEIRQMAALYQKHGLFIEAEKLSHCVVEFLLQHDGDEADLAIAFFALASSLDGQNRKDEAQKFYRRAVALWEKIDPSLLETDRTRFVAALQRIQDAA